jgi:hypothetical protein
MSKRKRSGEQAQRLREELARPLTGADYTECGGRLEVSRYEGRLQEPLFTASFSLSPMCSHLYRESL